MALPNIAGTVRCSLQGKAASGEDWVNVYHCRYAAGASSPGTTEIQALHAKLVRIYTGTAYASGAPWLSVCHPTVTLTKGVYYPLDGTTNVIELSASGVGSGGGNSLPSEVAFAVTIRTAVRGRRTRGRVFMVAPTVNATGANGNLSSATQAFIDNQFEGLITDLGTIQWKLGVASYGESWLKNKTDPHGAMTHSTWTPFFTEATSTSVDVLADVQRRRK